ncbi:Haf ABC transporter 4 [Aphelenchoides fujianensis]|nr:Haf ABC transporter 4 [Aphelenchoides fujianensis]
MATRWLPASIFFSHVGAFILVDLLVAVLALGFYHLGFEFSTRTLEDHLLWRQGFDALRSGGEFVCLALVRALLLVCGLVFLRARIPLVAFSLVLTAVFVLSCSYSLLKILLFAEIDGQLAFPGVWLSIVWTLLASLGLFALWTFRLRYEQQSYDAVTQQDLQQAATPKEEPPVRLSTLKQIWKLLTYARYNGGYFYAGFLFLFIHTVARIFIPYFTGEVIAEVVKGKAQSDRFMKLVLGMFGLILISGIFGGLRGGFFSYATSLVNRSLRKDLYRSILRQEIGWFDQIQTGEVISRLSSDCDTVSSVVSNNLNILFRNLFMMVGSICFMWALSWRLTLVTAIVIPPLGFFLKVYGVLYDRLGERAQTANARANDVANEVISTMRTVRSHASEKHEIGRYEERLAETIRVTQSKCIAEVGFNWISDFAENVVLLSILFYAGHLAIHGLMTVNQITSFLLYQLQMGEVFYYLNLVFTGVMEGIGASRKIFEFMRREPAIKYDGTQKGEVEGRIDFDGVTFAYPTRPNYDVLKDLTLSIEPGKTIAIVGPSGGGKSTIVALLEHWYEQANGSVRLDGVDIRQFDHAFYHRRVALVGQEPVLYSTSVRDNILYGLGAEDFAKDADVKPPESAESPEEGQVDVLEAKMIEAAKLANAHEFVLAMPDGYDTLCGEKGVQLSGIAIARALVRDPSVLILDEATSALDTTSEALIQDALQKCTVGRTVVVVAHRLSTIERADLICVVEKGRVVESGTHKSLMAEDGVYNKLVKRQMLERVVHD